MKEIIIKHEKKALLQCMLKGSKTDAILMNFKFSGHMLSYLTELPLTKARIILFRAWTKVNFQERWSESYPVSNT